MENLDLMPARIKIASILKKALFSGEYQSGQELSLTEIAEKLGVSRTPVREAFQALAADGLIELRMNRGAIVKPIDEKFIKDHYEMRALLESEAAARAATNGMDSASTLLARLHHVKDNLSIITQSEYEELNLDVHLGIWKAADNKKLYSFLSSLWNGPSIGFANPASEHYQKSTLEHIDVLDAIKKRDAERARSIMATHINRSMHNILNHFELMQTRS